MKALGKYTLSYKKDGMKNGRDYEGHEMVIVRNKIF